MTIVFGYSMPGNQIWPNNSSYGYSFVKQFIVDFSKKKLEALVEFLEKVEITKEMMGFDLDCLELVARMIVMNPESDCDGSSSDSESSSGTSDSDEDSDEEDDLSKNSSNLSVNEQVSREFELKLSLDSAQAAAKKKPLIEMLD